MRGRPGLTRPTIATLLALILAFPAAAPAAAVPVPDITGMFIDGWYPQAYPSTRPVTVDPDTMTVESDQSNVVVSGTGTDGLFSGPWNVVISTGTQAIPLVVGPAPLAQTNGGGSTCDLNDAGGDILELERAPDQTVTRFAASITTRCLNTNPRPDPVRVEIRYHSTLTYPGFVISPTPPISWPTPHSTLDFGDVAVGDHGDKTITITNTGLEPLDVSVDAPANPDFAIDTSDCEDPVAVAGSCSIGVHFEPTDVGTLFASLTITTPGLDTLERPITVEGRGTGVPTITLMPVGAAPEDWLIPDGGYVFAMDVQPQAARGFVNLDTTCGDDRQGAVGPQIPRPFHYVIVLPPGPCSATATLDGTNGWGDATSGPVDFDVPHFSLTWLQSSTNEGLSSGGWNRAALPVTLTATVEGTNGDAPSGGTLTISDDLTHAVLASEPVTAADTSISVELGVLAPGEHPYRATFSGDGIVAGSTKRYVVLIDGDLPSGSVAIDEPGGATADPEITLDLSATDASTDVTSMRVAATATMAGDVLADATTVAATDQLPWTLAGPDGTKTVHVQWRDAVGNWSVPVSASVILDRMAPTAGKPTWKPATGRRAFVGSHAPIAVRWSGSDTGASGIDGYDVDQSTDGGGFVRVATRAHSTSLTRMLTPGHTYRFRVRAIDRAGNVGAWAYGTTSRLDGIQQSSARVHYGGAWRTTSATAYWGGSLRRASVAGKTASLAFTGRAFAWVASVGPDRGVARVIVDGRTVATVDLHSTSRQSRVVVWSRSWTSAGRHTVIIRVLGTRGRPRVDVDGFLVIR